MSAPPFCEYRDDTVVCSQPATWTIEVGIDLVLCACDEHRNATLMRYEAKDVAGIYPIEADEPV